MTPDPNAPQVQRGQAVQEVAPPVSELHPEPGPRPVATLVLIAVLLLVTLAFWMMVLGIQQGRA